MIFSLDCLSDEFSVEFSAFNFEKHPKLIQDAIVLFYFSSLQNEASLDTWKIKTVIVTRTLKRYSVVKRHVAYSVVPKQDGDCQRSDAYLIMYHYSYW